MTSHEIVSLIELRLATKRDAKLNALRSKYFWKRIWPPAARIRSMTPFTASRAREQAAPQVSIIGHPQACLYPDACLRSDIVSGKAPLLGQGIWWTPLPLPGGRADALGIYQGPCPGRGILPDTSPIPKHTSG